MLSTLARASTRRTAALSRSFHATPAASDKIVCVLYPDPQEGYPPNYVRDGIPEITGYADGTTTPSPSGRDFTPGDLLGCVSGKLGLEKAFSSVGDFRAAGSHQSEANLRVLDRRQLHEPRKMAEERRWELALDT